MSLTEGDLPYFEVTPELIHNGTVPQSAAIQFPGNRDGLVYPHSISRKGACLLLDVLNEDFQSIPVPADFLPGVIMLKGSLVFQDPSQDQTSPLRVTRDKFVMFDPQKIVWGVNPDQPETEPGFHILGRRIGMATFSTKRLLIPRYGLRAGPGIVPLAQFTSPRLDPGLN